MEKYTLRQRIQIVEIYYENSRSVTRTLRALRDVYGRNDRPNKATIERLMARFKETGSVGDRPVPVRRRTARSNENIAAVAESVREDNRMSIPRRSQEVGLSQTSTWRILRKDLGLHPYKIQLTQELKPQDHGSRRTFADWVLEQLETDPHFGEKIIFSDEAHFWLNGYVNKQNCRIWDNNNPREILETPLYPERLTVWCGLWAGGIFGPYIFRNERNQPVTVNGERYRTMITIFFWPELDDMDLDDNWFQQDGATSHTAARTSAAASSARSHRRDLPAHRAEATRQQRCNRLPSTLRRMASRARLRSTGRIARALRGVWVLRARSSSDRYVAGRCP